MEIYNSEFKGATIDARLAAVATMQTAISNLETAVENKVDKVPGKGLSANDFTDVDKAKLDSVASGAQVNVIEGISVNGTPVTPIDKVANIEVQSSDPHAVLFTPQVLTAEQQEQARENIGASTGIDTVNVNVDNNTGIPSASGSVIGSTLSLAFSNLKGEPGAPGEPGEAGPRGPQGLQGPQGNTGANQDYPYELVNNLTTNDATKGLSAAMGCYLDSTDKLLDDAKLDKSPGVNLYNRANGWKATLNDAGVAAATTNNWWCSPFIRVTTGTSYCLHNGSGSALTSSSYICFYDRNQVFVSSIPLNTLTFTIPSGCEWLRFAHSNTGYPTVQLEQGSTASPYQAYDAAYGYTHDIKENIAGKLDTDYGTNIFDISTISSPGYLNNNGELKTNNNSYRASDYIPVVGGDYYYVSGQGDIGVGSSSVYHCFYDSNKTFISSSAVTGGTKQLTAPANAKYLRISILTENIDKEIQVEKGQARTAYMQYSPIAGYTPVLRAKQVTFSNLSDPVSALLTGGNSFKGWKDSGTVDANSSLGLGECHISKNTLISAVINGTIEDVCVGVGLSGTVGRSYGSTWVEIKPTTVELYRFLTGSTKLETYNHGLTLSNPMFVEIDSTREGSTETHTLRLMDKYGNTFEQALSEWGKGKPFVHNANSSGSVSVSLSFFPRDLTKKIWVFGDSYVTFNDSSRWPYYAAARNMDKWFANSMSGQGASSAYDDLVSILALGFIPSYIVWTLGMNGADDTGTEGNYVIADSQKSVIDDVVALCDQYGINLVLGTVPTVPTRQRTGFNSYVKSLGKRVIDFSDAVGATSAGVWNTGLLYSDGVHPSVAGAKVLAAQAFLDAPELAIIQ